MEQKRKVLIAGGTGLIGSHLARLLKKKGYEVAILSRSEPKQKAYLSYLWNPDKGMIDPEALTNLYAIINLAGTNVAGGLWTKGFKRKIYESRINATRLLVDKCRETGTWPQHFITGCAVGYFPSGDEWKTEDAAPGKDFLAGVCKDWENEALKAEGKVSVIRTGIVLANNGGFLSKVAANVKLGFGTQFGNGKQFISWIHIQDLIRIFTQILEGTIPNGTYNAAAPNPKTNKEITVAIASALRKPLWLPPVPAFVLKLILGDFSTELLASHRISSEKLIAAGFGFQFPDLPAALEDLLSPR